jgi:hypothetical protein
LSVGPAVDVAVGLALGLALDVAVGLSLSISVIVGSAEPGMTIRPVRVGDGKDSGIGVRVGEAVAAEQLAIAKATSSPARPKEASRGCRP